MTKVKESTKYEGLLGVKESVPSLEDFIEVTEADSVNPNQWQKHWKGMPAYQQNDNNAYKSVIINFRNQKDYEDFAKLIGQPLTEKTKSTWHPRANPEQNSLNRWIEE